MNYETIDKCSVSNGLGIRVVLWVSGCSIHCYRCHNPQTWDFNSGRLFTESTMQELLELIGKPYIKGFTLSGGHPLDPRNADEVYRITNRVRQAYPSKSIWLYTGYTWEHIFELAKFCKERNFETVSPLDIVKLCDVVVDGAYVDSLRDISLPWAGSTNQRVIDVKKSLAENKIILYEQED